MGQRIFPFINRYGNLFEPGKSGDVGHDLYVMLHEAKMSVIDSIVSELVGTWAVVVWPFRAKILPTGIHVGLDDSTWCQIVARSSAAKRGFMVISGIIDSGYQGELFTNIYNFGLLPKIVRHGERYSQVIFFPAIRPLFKKVVGFIKPSERGSTGFGSTGS